MQHKLIPVVCVVGVMLLALLLVWRWRAAPPLDIKQAELNHQQLPVQLAGRSLTVEIVNTPESRERGLSGRSELTADGMLFVFDKPTLIGFWMKDMLFNLDLIWIKDGRVVDITENAPKPEVGQDWRSLPMYAPAQPVDLVLEVPAGAVDAWQVQVGSSLTHPDASLVDP